MDGCAHWLAEGLPVHAGSPEARRPPGRRDTTTLVWASSPKAGRPLRPTHRLSYRACASRGPLRGPRGLDVGRACLGEEGGGGGSLPYGAHPTGAWPATRTENKKAARLRRPRPGRRPCASGYPTLLSPPERARGGSNVPYPALSSPSPGRLSGPGRPDPYLPLVKHPLVSELWPTKNKTKKLVQLLAVDHSARASMKNAASCEK